MITCHPLKVCGGVCICRDPALCLDFLNCVVFCCVYNVSGRDTHAQPVTAQGWDYKNLYLLPLCELQFGQNEVHTFNPLKFQLYKQEWHLVECIHPPIPHSSLELNQNLSNIKICSPVSI